MPIVSKEEAQEFIEQVLEENGLVTAEEREYLRRGRPGLLKKFDNMRSKLGNATKTLTENIFSKETRFVYELIQNADDNKYKRANSRGELPTVSFLVSRDRIVIDLNEDGFNEANIRAICSVGESTKSHSKGYVGEKGIGFKSVFRVAHKVHIQSGFFSFAFEYRIERDATGLEMVTPIVQEQVDLPDGVGTRITLDVLEDYDREDLFRQFEELPVTLLLFLRKLKVLKFSLERSDNQAVKTSYRLESDPDSKWLTVHKRSGSESTEVRFITFRETITDMPEDKFRMFKRSEDSELERVTDAEVVLAFPVGEDDEPIIEDQDVFAFLPLRPAGFKFIIQSDFIALASREDIFQSRWNKHLRNRVLTLLVRSIRQFLDHPTLGHSWIRYLSIDDISDPFWKPLQTTLSLELSKRRFFFNHDGNLATLSDLRIVPDKFRDDNNNPLFDDEHASFAYISDEYNEDELAILQKLGVKPLTHHEFIVLVRLDLQQDDNTSCMKANWSSAQWHSSVSDILYKSMKKKDLVEEIRLLPLVPLTKGNWVVPKNASIFFPTCGGITIPPELHQLNIVDPGAVANQERFLLFERLEISECKPVDVFDAIEKRYARSGSIRTSFKVSDIEFLYWHHNEIGEKKLKVSVSCNDGGGYKRSVPFDQDNGWSYSPQPIGRYSAATIFKSQVPEQLHKKMRFLMAKYYQQLKRSETRHGVPPIQWFNEYVGAKTTIQLFDRGGGRLFGNGGNPSPEFIYITTHRPELLLGILAANWTNYVKAKPINHTTKNLVCQAEIPILNSDSKVKVEETFLPNPDMVERIEELGLLEGFGFIKEIQHSDSNWRFLSEFGVGVEQNLGFWLAALKKAREKQQVKTITMRDIYFQLWSFSKTTEAQGIVRQLFDSPDKYIYMSDLEENSKPERWFEPKDCVWTGPKWLTRPRLSSIPVYAPLQEFFIDILKVRNAKLTDILDHLNALTNSSEDPVEIHLVYDHLATLARQSIHNKEQIREVFKDERFIFDHKDQDWYYLSDCIWAEDKIRLPGLVSIAAQYQKIQHFFVDILEIESPQLEMHIDALKLETEGENPARARVLELIECICGYDPSPRELSELEDCKCFPVNIPGQGVEWMACSGTFAVGDRRTYLEMFRDQIPCVDFSLEEIHSFEKFFSGLNIQSKFLSVLVRAETDAFGWSIHDRLTMDVRRKSYAICRVLAHSKSERALRCTEDIMELFENVDVYNSEQISRTLCVSLDERDEVRFRDAIAYAHLEEHEDKLSIYVPSRERELEVCLKRHLPELLLKHFGAHSVDSTGNLGLILTSSTLFSVDETLEHAGIISLRGAERSPNDETSEEDSDFAGSAGDSSEILPSRETVVVGQDFSPDVASTAQHSRRAVSAPLLNAFPSGPRIRTTEEEEYTNSSFWGRDANVFDSNMYERLLNICVDRGRSLQSVPRRGSAVSDHDSDGYFNDVEIRQAVAGDDQKSLIGAAGELYVYEWLRQLGLPEFNCDNWKSTIRSRVNFHNEYRDLQNFRGAETSDIVYEDVNGKLTSLLIEQRYLDRDIWANQCPRYYIEVKTTINDLDAPFYVSHDQYRLICDHELQDGAAARDIVLIIRAFKLGGAGMGLKLFLDPAKLERRQELKFVGSIEVLQLQPF